MTSRVAWVLAGVALWIASLRFPAVGTTLSTEDGWMWGLGILFERRARVGTDWIYTHGPLGFFVQRAYDADLHLGRWAWELAIKAIYVVVAFAFLRRTRSLPGRVLLYAALFCLPASDDAAYGLLVLLAGLLVLREDDLAGWIHVALGLVVAALSLARFSLCLLGAFVVLVGAVHLASSGRRTAAIAWVTSFAGGMLLLGALLGQSPADLAGYLRAGLELSRGYSDAMSVEGPPQELFAALAMIALVLPAVLGPRPAKLGLRGALAGSIVGIALLLSFKEGFTRHDHQHALRTFAFALPVILVLPAALDRLDWSSRIRRSLLCVSAALAVSGVVAVLGRAPDGAERWPDPPGNLARGAHGLFRPWKLRSELERKLAAVRASHDRPRIRAVVGEASVDVLGNYQGIAMVNDLRWSPRYSLQSYAAYTDRIAGRNAGSLLGPAAPEFLIADGVSIDYRYPTVEDGPAVLAMLRSYTPVAAENGFLVLRRAGSASAVPLETLSVVLRPGTIWVLPPGNRPLAARIRCKKTVWGHVRGALLRTPTLWLGVETRNGELLKARLLPSLERSSFLLSPVLTDIDDWIDAYTSSGAGDHIGHLGRIRIDEEGGGGCFDSFELEVDVLPSLTGPTIDAQLAAALHADVHAP